ncbi:MAG: peptidoglycan-binding domain-containing protein, partial [Alphaproteobacteria bacterium]
MGRQSGNALTYDDLDFLSDQFATASDSSPSLVDDRTTTILLAQAHLSYFGYQPGPLDGLEGPTTRSAIARFQHDKGMAPDGEASNSLLTILRDELPDWSSPAIAATPQPHPARVTA